MSALDKQIGGTHYKKQGIQPIEYILQNKLGFCEGNIIKYVTRYKQKNGLQDLEKAKHYLEFLIEETRRELDEKFSPFDEDRIDIIGQNGNEGHHYK